MLLVLVIALIYAPRIARMARAAALDIVTRDFVTVAKLRGESAWSVMRRELLPNATSVLLVEFALRAGYAPVLIGSLGFLGFGVRPPTPEWGLIMSENRSLIIFSPITVLGPGLMLASLVVGLNLFTEGLARILGRTVRLGRQMSAGAALSRSSISTSPTARAMAGRGSCTASISPIARGEAFGLVGESGCGKSTVAYQLMGYRRENSRIEGGRVVFQGVDLLRPAIAPALDRLRGNRISLVPQNPTTALSPGMRVGPAGRPRSCNSTVPCAARKRSASKNCSAWSGLPDPDSDRPALSASAFGRPAAARLHCHGARLRARSGGARRADNGPRCHDAGADHRASGGPAGPARHVDALCDA